MGYRGKVEAQAKARALRAENRTLAEIAEVLGVSKASVSIWVRDIEVEIRRAGPMRRRANSLHDAKLVEIDELNRRGVERIGVLSEAAFLAAGVALYAGEGSKTDGKVLFANTNAEMVALFCHWLRRFFDVDESRLRARVYLHDGLDLEAAESFWSKQTGIPRDQFRAPYRAVADSTIRATKHERGCAYVYYCCSRTHREIMGLVRALLSSGAIPG